MLSKVKYILKNQNKDVIFIKRAVDFVTCLVGGSLNLNYIWQQGFPSPSRGQQEISQVSRELWYCKSYYTISSINTCRTKSILGLAANLTFPSVSHLQSYSWKKLSSIERRSAWNYFHCTFPDRNRLWQSDCNSFGASFLPNFSEENF